MNAYTAFLLELRDWCSTREGWGSNPADSAAILATVLGGMNIVTMLGLAALIGDRDSAFFAPGVRNKLLLLAVVIPMYFANVGIVRRQERAGTDALRPMSLRSRMYVYVSFLAFFVGVLIATFWS